MYAVIKSGGKQYCVTEGEDVRVEKLGMEPGSAVEFKDVLLIKADDKTVIGRPLVEGATVTGTIEENALADTVLVFKYKAKKQYRRTRGHRQPYSKVHIDKINLAAEQA